jgi:WD40 repeat protein
MSLQALLGIDWLCKIIENYASEFKGHLCTVMPSIMDGKLPHPFFNRGSIAEFDGKIAFTAKFNKLEVIDPRTATKVANTFAVNYRMVFVSQHVLATFFMGKVSLLDMQSEECLWSKKVATAHDVFDLKLLPDNQLAAFDGLGFVVWEIKSGDQLRKLRVPRLHDIVGVSRDSVVAAVDDFLRVYDKHKLVITQPARGAMQLLALQGSRFASSGKDHTVAIWDTGLDHLTCLYIIEDAKCGCMEQLSDGSLAVTCADGHHIRVYHGNQLVHNIPYFGWPIYALKALADNRLASFHMYGDVCIWH